MPRVARAHPHVARPKAAAAAWTRGKTAEVGRDGAGPEAALREAHRLQVDHLVVHALDPVPSADLNLRESSG